MDTLRAWHCWMLQVSREPAISTAAMRRTQWAAWITASGPVNRHSTSHNGRYDALFLAPPISEHSWPTLPRTEARTTTQL